MATRQERQIGLDLSVNATTINNIVYSISEILQDRHPATREKFLIEEDVPAGSDALPGFREPTIDEIKIYTGKLLGVVDKRTGINNAFIGKTTDSVLINSLMHYTVTRPHLDSDVTTAQTKKDVAATVSLESNKSGLKAIGSNVAYESHLGIADNIYRPKMDFDSKFANIANSCLDALSYELQGRCSYKGTVKILKIEQLKATAHSRCKVAILEGSKSKHIDALGIVSFAELVKAQIDDCKTDKDLEQLGVYIDSNIEKLPLLRRSWA